MTGLIICNKCGGECSMRGADSLDYCNSCGIVEGNTHIEIDGVEE